MISEGWDSPSVLYETEIEGIGEEGIKKEGINKREKGIVTLSLRFACCELVAAAPYSVETSGISKSSSR